MGAKNSKQEEIIVEAAGSGNNNAAQSASQGHITLTDWLLITVLVVIAIICLLYGVKKLLKSMRKIAKQEIQMHELRKSQAELDRV